MRYDPINPELFKLNRRRFTQKMKPDSIVIFLSNDLMPRNGDTYYPFRQNSDLFYLSGLDQEETVLVLFPDCIKDGFHELAFIKRTNEHVTIWEGEKYTKEQASEISGIERIYWLDEMEYILRELILLSKRIYLNTNEHDHFRSDVLTSDKRFAHKLMEQYPLHKYHRAQPILRKLSMTKSHFEVDLIQRSIEITGKAFQRVLGFVRPNVMEYEIEAEITHEFIKNRAHGHAYEPILASGPNTCTLHYTRNTRQCQDGDLLLMDFGAEYANYASDCTRTIPVNGLFTARQRQVYDAVLHILRSAVKLLVPGKTMDEYNEEVGKIVEEQLVSLCILTREEINRQSKSYPAYKKYFMHSISHHLGKDVHDLSSRYAPLQAGMVLTVEPGIYLREENIGIRLENIILITDQQPIDLTKNIPIEAEDIEHHMSSTLSTANN